MIKKLQNKWIKILNLTSWDITFKPITELENHDTQFADCYGVCFRKPEYSMATICFNHELLNQNPDQIERTIAHELLHVYVADMFEAGSIATDSCQTDKEKEMSYLLFSNAEEKLVVKLTELLLKTHGE